MVAKIVETEAYMGPIDKASHAYNNRKTNRTVTMFKDGGYSYVYFIYGMYNCLNVVCSDEGTVITSYSIHYTKLYELLHMLYTL